MIGSSRLFNPQQQIPMTWPAKPVIARAYIDQLMRDEVLEEDTTKIILERLEQVDAAMKRGGSNNRLAKQINSLQLPLEDLKIDLMTRHRLKKLDSTLKNIAEGLNR